MRWLGVVACGVGAWVAPSMASGQDRAVVQVGNDGYAEPPGERGPDPRFER